MSRDVAESLAARYERSPLRAGQVAKRDVLAFITWYGEEEIIVTPECVEEFGERD